jgi:ureidoglycolate lyase
MIQDERHMHSELGSQAAERLLGAVTMHQISIAPLTGAAFGPYGEVVEMDGSDLISINQGFAARFDTLAKVDVATAGASVNISLFVAKARPLPIDVKLMERHPLGTQLFFPLQDKPWLVLVCADPRVPASFRAFRASGRQGVNYARNTWHHPLLVLTDEERFLVVDRKGAGDNLEEVWLDDQHRLCLSPYV